MDWTTDSGDDDGDNFWDTDDDSVPENPSIPPPARRASAVAGRIDEAGPSRPSLIPHFVDMGFPEELVENAIKNNEEGNHNAILQTLLNSVQEKERSHFDDDGDGDDSSIHSSSASLSLEEEEDDDDDDGDYSYFSDLEGFSAAEKVEEDFTTRDGKLAALLEMGFAHVAASSAISKCGEHASIVELTDFIYAADMAEKTDDNLAASTMASPAIAESCIVNSHIGKKRRRLEEKRKPAKKLIADWEEQHSTGFCSLPKPMVGFGLPGVKVTERKLPELAAGPPFFYYENVALTPIGVWERISNYLYGIEPEFVDSKFFCATARKRGYVHNLPIVNRFALLPIPPKTIKEALPWSAKWMPKWDQRIHLNCLHTCVANARLTERIRSKLADSGDPPPDSVQKYVIQELRTWNLVWVGRHKVAPLEPDEMEMLLGYPRHHTRGITRTERYKSLGNSFQVDTVAFHLSVLKDMFPDGIKVLSLFSGIGGAEIALHRLGIHLNVVVSVEISESNRNILRCWWEENNLSGTLIHMDDIQEVNIKTLEKLCESFGGFDLVIGGSPCNNLTGSNRYTRDGLEGEHSSLFYDFYRILDLVKCMMRKKI